MMGKLTAYFLYIGDGVEGKKQFGSYTISTIGKVQHIEYLKLTFPIGDKPSFVRLGYIYPVCCKYIHLTCHVNHFMTSQEI